MKLGTVLKGIWTFEEATEIFLNTIIVWYTFYALNLNFLYNHTLTTKIESDIFFLLFKVQYNIQDWKFQNQYQMLCLETSMDQDQFDELSASYKSHC